MTKKIKAQQIFLIFSLVYNRETKKYFFSNKKTKEKTKEFSSKEEALDILQELNEEDKISNDQELDLITMILKKETLPYNLFEQDSRESYLDHSVLVIGKFNFRLRFLKNLQGGKKKMEKIIPPYYAKGFL